jgi:endonuclease YncB( thermonuclease family)
VLRNSRFRLLVFVVLCLACACLVVRRFTRGTSSSGEAPSRFPLQVTVRHVVDGDSFVTAERREVRLLGIDTPERDEPFARQARSRLEKLILGKRVSLTYEKKKEDRYERLLCHVRIDDVWVNKLQVRDGLAVVYLIQPSTAFRSELVFAQNAARREKIGIWSLPPPSPEKYYLRSSKRFRFHRPDCRSIRKTSARNMVKLRTRDEAFDMGLSPCRDCRP